MKNIRLILVAVALIPISLCAQNDGGRLDIEGVTLGMSSADLSIGLEERGWAPMAASLYDARWILGEFGQAPFQFLNVRYPLSGDQVVTEVWIEFIDFQGRPDDATLAALSRDTFDELVALYGEPDACPEDRDVPDLSRRCTWTRSFNEAQETLEWVHQASISSGARILSIRPGPAR